MQNTNTALAAFANALDFAAGKHAGQRRKNVAKTPYINHPIRVAYLLAKAGIADEAILAAALLHDTIEDTGTTAKEIASEFGEPVAALVLECSDDKSKPFDVRKRLQVEHAGGLSRGARLIKVADKIANLADLIDDPPPAWDKARRVEYARWSFEVLKAIGPTDTPLDNLAMMMQMQAHSAGLYDASELVAQLRAGSVN